MPNMLFRIFLVYNLFNSILLFLVPKKLRIYLPSSWYQQQQNTNNIIIKPDPSHKPSRRMDPAELKRVFEMFDRNGDGWITKQELNDSLENMGIFIPDRDLAGMIEKIDTNGDGCVDIDEFEALYRNIMDERDVEEDMREAFNVFDQNGDGYITVDELKAVLASLGLKQGRAADDCKKMIMRVDADGDGMVDFCEFKQMMRRGGFAAAL